MSNDPPPPTPAPDPANEPAWDEFAGKALIASRSPWGTIAGGIIAWLVARYGLDWDSDTCNLVAGAGVVLASYGMRYIASGPITGIFKPKPTADNLPSQ